MATRIQRKRTKGWRMPPNTIYVGRGKDLACWCRLDQECHADVLLAVLNEEEPDV